MIQDDRPAELLGTQAYTVRLDYFATGEGTLTWVLGERGRGQSALLGDFLVRESVGHCLF